MNQLTRSDAILLVAILCLGGDAYSTTVLDGGNFLVPFETRE